MKKILSIMLIFAFAASLIPAGALADSVPYAVVGISDGERILINDRAFRTISVIDASKLNTSAAEATADSATSKCYFAVQDAENVKEVAFSLNNATSVIDDQAPYQWDMPFEKLGKNTLNVSVTTLDDVIYSFDYSFELVYGEMINRTSNNFEANPSGLGFAQSYSTYAQQIVNYENHGNMLELKHTAEEYNNRYFMVKTADRIKLDQIEMVRMKVDILRKGNGARIELGFGQNPTCDSSSFNAGKTTEVGGLFTMLSGQSDVFADNKKYTVEVDYDITNNIAVVYVDGWEYVRLIGNTKLANIKNWTHIGPRMAIHHYGHHVYIDNVSIEAYSQKTVGELVLNESDNEVFSVNPVSANENVEFVVIAADYTDASCTTLDVARAQAVVLKPGDMFIKRFNPADNSKFKLFVWEDIDKCKPLTK